MGISGLLTTLKSIQVTRHLSDFAGQTLAVDAYVWLHRGIYTCATELATGKSTVRYVDYAMQRIRLLRHHSIQPYVVFDGGPLPAKLETESGRRKRREENLAKAKTLTAEGKKSQAREFYAKCVDVTPQMAYQLIKALRAEGVQYVVAPYEADAQMAYLERKGLVDGIITEDSDLLVFGCRNVLFKFDCASSTVVNIRRADFGSVTVADGGISLAGWTDGQFRAMAILSGCDYLPSIPGIGLKTAWSLLRKHRSVEQVLRTLRLDGKKSVPKGYLDAFQLAEKVFLYQRVYCPLEERLVTLTESSAEQKYDAEMEAYIGRNLEPSLAKPIALGELDPVTLLDMVDINPSFVPHVLRTLPLQFNDIGRGRPGGDKAKGKVKANCSSGNLFSFFSPKPALQLSRSKSAPTKKPVVGKNSGKRSLSDLLDEDIVAKRMKMESTSRDAGTSKWMCDSRNSGMQDRRASTSSSLSDYVPDPRYHHQARTCGKQIPPRYAKENISPCGHLADEIEELPIAVNQEDGYISPTPSYFRSATPDLSSPVRHPYAESRGVYMAGDDFEADIISSPVAMLRSSRNEGPARSLDTAPAEVLVRSTPSPTESEEINGPCLRDILSITTPPSQTESFEQSATSTPSTSGPVTPEDPIVDACRFIDEVMTDEDFEVEPRLCESRTEIVANGWWNKWALKQVPSNVTKPPNLRRIETTITPTGRQSGYRSARGKPKSSTAPHNTGRAQKTLQFPQHKSSGS